MYTQRVVYLAKEVGLLSNKATISLVIDPIKAFGCFSLCVCLWYGFRIAPLQRPFVWDMAPLHWMQVHIDKKGISKVRKGFAHYMYR